MVMVRYLGAARRALALLFLGTATMRSALAGIAADGTPIDLLPSLLGFIGIGEARELEQRRARS